MEQALGLRLLADTELLPVLLLGSFVVDLGVVHLYNLQGGSSAESGRYDQCLTGAWFIISRSLPLKLAALGTSVLRAFDRLHRRRFEILFLALLGVDWLRALLWCERGRLRVAAVVVLGHCRGHHDGLLIGLLFV